jgi:hypothetical protein
VYVCLLEYVLYAGRKEGATYCNVKVQRSGGTDGGERKFTGRPIHPEILLLRFSIVKIGLQRFS